MTVETLSEEFDKQFCLLLNSLCHMIHRQYLAQSNNNQTKENIKAVLNKAQNHFDLLPAQIEGIADLISESQTISQEFAILHAKVTEMFHARETYASPLGPALGEFTNALAQECIQLFRIAGEHHIDLGKAILVQLNEANRIR